MSVGGFEQLLDGLAHAGVWPRNGIVVPDTIATTDDQYDNLQKAAQRHLSCGFTR